MEGINSQGNKEQDSGISIPVGSSLDPDGRFAQTGQIDQANLLSTDLLAHPPTQHEESFSIRNFPQPPLESHPFLQAIRPLASSGIYSPPPSLPLVTLPGHTPISPIPNITSQTSISNSSSSIFLSPEYQNTEVPRLVQLADHLDYSNVRDWIATLTPEQEWDTYNPTPTFCSQLEFWNSRRQFPSLATSTRNEITSHYPLYSAPTVSYCSESSSISKEVSPAIQASNMADLDSACSQLHTAFTKTRYLINRLTVGDVDEDSVTDGIISDRLKEIRDLEISLGCSTQDIIEKYKSELSEERLSKLNTDIKDLSASVKAHEKLIRAKMRELKPPKSLTSYETEMFRRKFMILN